jgi:transposase, IS5 family
VNYFILVTFLYELTRYDAGYNYKAISDIGATPIIKMVIRTKSSTEVESRYTIDELGIPHCKAGVAMLLKDRNKKTGVRYVCPHRAGRYDCPLAKECNIKVARIAPFYEYRKYCSIPRDSTEWNGIYDHRTSIERVNSRLKESRRLNSHCHRGLAKVRIHSLMSVLSLLVTALAEAKTGNLDRVRTCTRMIA